MCCIIAVPQSDRMRAKRLTIMHDTLQESAILQKTKELCQAILDEPSMQSVRQRIDAFLDDSETRAQYEAVVSRGQTLHEKQQASEPLSGEELSAFESQRESLLSNPVARGYLDAQEELHNVQQSVQKQISKTFELGRMPTEEDLSGGGGCCSGGGCSCH